MKANKQYLLRTNEGVVQVIKSNAISYVTMIAVGIGLGSLCSYFPFYYILAVAIIPVLFLFQINHKYFLLLLLILGFVLFARGFAYLGIEIGGLPLYITEAVLFATVGILLLDKLVAGGKVSYLENIPLKKEFAFFYLVGFIALIRGFISYTPVLTLRHSALFYYSIFYFLMPILFTDLRRIELLFKMVFVACIIIPIAILLKVNFMINTYGALGDYSYLYLSLAVIFESVYLAYLKKRIHKVLLILIIFLQLFVILRSGCRAAWFALCVSLLFLLYLSLKKGKLKRRTRTLFLYVVLGGIILLIFTASVNPVLFNAIKSEVISTLFFYRMQTVSASNVWWRLFIWRDMVRELSRKPLFGWGFGKPFRSPTLEALGWEHGAKEGWIDPHNSHLNIAYKTGVIGFSIFLLIMVRFFRRTMSFLRHIRQDDKIELYVTALLTCVVYVLTIALFLVILEGPYMGSFLWISMGLIVALENIYKKMEAKS